MPKWYGWVGIHIFDRLIERFSLQTTPLLPEDPFILHKQIVPVTQIDELLKTWNVVQVYEADPGSTGWKTVHTVPKGKRQGIRAISVTSDAATTKFNHYRIGPAVPIIIEIFTEAQAKYTGILHQDIVLKEDWTIGISVSTWQVGDTVSVILYYWEEDAF